MGFLCTVLFYNSLLKICSKSLATQWHLTAISYPTKSSNDALLLNAYKDELSSRVNSLDLNDLA